MTRRRRFLVLTAVVGAALVLLLTRLLPSYVAVKLAQSLSDFFHRPVSIAEVRFHVYPLEIEIRDLRVSGEGPEARPFLEVPRAFVAPSLAGIRLTRLSLARIRLEAPRIYVHSYPSEGDNIPKTGGGGGGGAALELSLDRLVIQRGELVLEQERIPLDLDLPDFRGRLTRVTHGMQGQLSFGPGSLRLGSAPALPVGMDMTIRIEGPVVTVESGRLQAPGTDLAWRGQMRFAGKTLGQFTLDGALDLDMLDRHVMRTGFGIRGLAHWEGTVSVDGSRFRIDGRMEGANGVFDGNAVERFAGQLAWSDDGVVIRRLDLDALGGTGTLDLDVPSDRSRPVRIAGPMTGVDVEALVRAVFKYGPLGIGGAATGDILVEWPKGKARQLSGSMALDVAERTDGRTPVAGRFEWQAKDGLQLVDRVDLRTPTTRVRASGRIEANDQADLSLDADSTSLAEADDLVLRIRRALGNAEAQPVALGGSGVFRGSWRGTLAAPVFEGRFSGNGLDYAGVVWGKVEWVGSTDADTVRSHSLVVSRGPAELWLDGLVETGFFGGADALDFRVRLKSWPAQDVEKAMGWELGIEGPVSGEATVRGRRSRPAGTAEVTATNGVFYRVPYEEARVSAQWKDGLTVVTAGRATLGGGSVAFRGSATDDGVYDALAEVEAVEVGAVLPRASPPVQLGGRVSGRATLSGTIRRPRVRATLRSPHLFIGDEGLGAVEASLLGAGDGRVTIDARCRSARVDLGLSGTIETSDPYPADLRVEAKTTSLDPFLRAAFPGLPPTLGIVATGSAALRGPLRSRGAISGDVSLSELAFLLPEYPVRNREPVRLELAAGVLSLRALHLAGEGTDLEVTGSAGLVGAGPLDVTVRGTADLRAVDALSRRLRGSGSARLTAEVSGTTADPRVEGRLTFDGAGFRVRGFPHGLEEARGTVRFSESALEVDGLTGKLAGGAVELHGRATYVGGKVTSFDFTPVGRGLAVRYPEGMRSLLDADLHLFGDEDRQWLTGSVDVEQSTYSRRYDVASELLAVRTSADSTPALDQGLNFDVKVHAPGTLRIDNNLANLQARAEVTLQGTLAEPVLVGRAEVDRGRIYFQGQTYVIRRGIIDFTNPRKIDPVFDMEAETRIRSYRVTLKVNGTLDRVTPTLSSDPPLSQVQILNLMAGADDSVVTSLTEAQAGQAQLAATGAATLAAGRLSEQVGLERGVERVFGLNRFSIDPSIVRGGAGTVTSARLTVGKRLTPDLSVIYSQDLRGTEERILSVEYILSDRLSLLLTREQPGGFGFDVRLRQSRQ